MRGGGGAEITTRMGATHARALVANLDLRPAQPQGDAALLERLARLALRRWSPIAAVCPPDGIWIDIAGCGQRWGPAERFCSHLVALCARAGFTARIAVADSSWMKHHHPDVFCAALMNAQPMGFYAPAQIVRDAREHGIEVWPPCVNASRWDATPEPTGGPWFTVRLGLRQVRSLSNVDGAAIVITRGDELYTGIDDVWRRAGVKRVAIERLAEADAFHAFGADRRQGLWKVRGLGESLLPLFAATDRAAATFAPETDEPGVELRPLTDGREVVEDYRALQLSLRAHPLTFLRDELTRRGNVRCADLATTRDGRHVEVVGIILVRQKPGSAKGVLFLTIEDETGIANGIFWPDRFEAQRCTVMSASMIGMKGWVQREGEVIHAHRRSRRTPVAGRRHVVPEPDGAR